MHLKVMQPINVLIDERVTKVTAEGEEGSFCLLPQHVDWIAALVPGILSFESETGEEIFLAIDEGILVKQGAMVWVSVRSAVRGVDLETLHQTVQQQFRQLDEQERQARSTLARLETSFVREFMELGGSHEIT
ncbi:MAG TPA: F0F1 ATP synthase subunit epsilon [Leptolyngbyaceae cyanobacterium M33_DOE_097]|uniref:F0F1 ATP synthase subunit epsilon n=1 Tax=Oscillatoriales cyanobacterium SpSt-418 TaxID=2282169 RepID=A0A7C3PGS4_9CYAN|nr:F0F1 ATP synthase subunit epsilon [Leptolyngbyaceae cyanobacterium M33_DOE_097]